MLSIAATLADSMRRAGRLATALSDHKSAAPPDQAQQHDEAKSDEQYRVTSRIEIVAILRALVDDHVLVTVFYDGLEKFFLTRILALNPDFEEIVFDGVSDPVIKRGLRDAVGLTVHAFHHQIKIVFDGDQAELTLWDQRPAFRMRVPSSLVRLQRRSDYRTKAPVLAAATLAISVAGEATPIRFRVFDISCGGLSFAAAVGKCVFSVGENLTDGVLDLPRVGRIDVALEVRHIWDYQDGLGRQMKRYGCRFQHFSGASATLVQRYINQVDIDRRDAMV